MSSIGEKRKFASRRRSKKKFRGRRPGESDDHETIEFELLKLLKHETVEFDQPVEGEEVRDFISGFTFLFEFYTKFENTRTCHIKLCYISSGFLDQC